MRDRLLIFTRYPTPGQTKTRLIPILGAEGAAKLQRQLTEETLAKAKALAPSHPAEIAVYYSGGSDRRMREWLGNDLIFTPQADGDLGVRMQRAFDDAFAAGMEGAIAIGIDCPDLSADLLQTAFIALKNVDVVLGPAADGGYYLLGLRKTVPDLFRAMPWGSDRVFSLTIRRIEKLNLSLTLLPALRDLDRPEDLDLIDWQLEQ